MVLVCTLYLLYPVFYPCVVLQKLTQDPRKKFTVLAREKPEKLHYTHLGNSDTIENYWEKLLAIFLLLHDVFGKQPGGCGTSVTLPDTRGASRAFQYGITLKL